MNIVLIGAGTMGRSVAANHMKAGHALTVHSRTMRSETNAICP